MTCATVLVSRLPTGMQAQSQSQKLSVCHSVIHTVWVVSFRNVLTIFLNARSRKRKLFRVVFVSLIDETGASRRQKSMPRIIPINFPGWDVAREVAAIHAGHYLSLLPNLVLILTGGHAVFVFAQGDVWRVVFLGAFLTAGCWLTRSVWQSVSKQYARSSSEFTMHVPMTLQCLCEIPKSVLMRGLQVSANILLMASVMG